MTGDDAAVLLDSVQIAMICGCVLFIGITIGMYVERVFVWQNKLVSQSSSTSSAQEREALLEKPEKVVFVRTFCRC